MHGLQIVATLIMKGGFFPAPFLFKEFVKKWKTKVTGTILGHK